MIYTKPRAELFAQDAPPSEIKPFAAWLRGLGIAFDETNGYPEMESFNGLLQALNGYIKYLEQNGFAEWSADLEYPVGAGIRVGAVWYRAKAQNLNKPPATSQNEWTVFLNASDLSFSDPLQVVGGVIGVKDASTTQKGVVRMATSAEVANRTNVSAAITPANVGQTFGQSLAANGWCRLPNGLIMQWGVTEPLNTDTSINISFPIQFPSSCLNITASPRAINPQSYNGSTSAYTSNVTRAGATLTNDSSTFREAFAITWFAIGY